jgi:hypothetical protein
MRQPAARMTSTCARQVGPRADRIRRDRVVEGVIEQPVLAARSEIGVQRPEIRNPPRIGNGGFLIEDQVCRRQGRERSGTNAARGTGGPQFERAATRIM